MTTLNTIIEEEKNEAHNKLNEFCFEEIFSDSGAKEFDRLIDTLLTTAMQRAYEAGRQSMSEESKTPNQ